LHASFREWSIKGEITTILCPLLALQGVDDEYGTLRQIQQIKRHLKQSEYRVAGLSAFVASRPA
jgi:hypothetical protein